MPTIPSPHEIAAAIREVTADILEQDPRGILAINDGYCEDLAYAVLERLGVKEGVGIDTVEMGCLGAEFEGPLDIELLNRMYPASRPPVPLTWDDLDSLGVTDVRHIWLFSEGKHYDADAPDGVDNLFDLPIVRRYLAFEITSMQPEAVECLMAKDYWRDSFAMMEEVKAWRAAQQSSASSPRL